MPVKNRDVATRLILLVLAVWLPILALLVFEPLVEIANGRRVGLTTALINLCGVAFLLLGIILSPLSMRDRKEFGSYQPWGPRADLIALSILLFASLVGAYLGILAWRELGIDPLSLGGSTLYEMNVMYAQEERVVSGLSGRLTVMALAGLLYTLHLQREKRINRPVAVAYGLLFVLAMISPRRALLLSAVTSAVMLWFLAQEKINLWQAAKLVLPLLAIVLLFGFTQFLLQKSNNYSIFGSIQLVAEYYALSFYVMDSIIDTGHFEQTFIILSVPERIAGYIFNYQPNVDLSIPFVYVPTPANTVPAFYYFYKSGGYLGVVLSSLVIGWVLSRLYAGMVRKPSLFNVVASSLFATGIVLSPRQCLFIEYDFVFLLAVAFVIDQLRKSSWFRRGFRRNQVLSDVH